jgi:hypothetical protein
LDRAVGDADQSQERSLVQTSSTLRPVNRP